MKLTYPVATPDSQDAGILACRGRLEESLPALAEIGYQGVEFMVRNPVDLDAAAIRRLADSLHLSIAGVSTGQLRKEDGLQLCQLDEAARRRAVDRTKQVIDFTAALGAPQINIGTLRGGLPAPDRDAALQAARESLLELLDYAQERSVGIALEPQNRYISNWLNTVDETLRWMEQFPHGNLSLLFDAYHAALEERSLYAALIRAFPRVSHVQVADSNRLAPGWGQADLGGLIRVLHALGYTGHVSVEIEQRPDNAAAARQAANWLTPFLNESAI